MVLLAGVGWLGALTAPAGPTVTLGAAAAGSLVGFVLWRRGARGRG